MEVGVHYRERDGRGAGGCDAAEQDVSYRILDVVDKPIRVALRAAADVKSGSR